MPEPAANLLTRIVASQSWKWLVDIRRRLDVVVEVFDEKSTLLLPPLDGRGATAVRRLIVPIPAEPLLGAVQRSMRDLTQEVVTVGGFCFTCTPIVVVGHAIAALLVGEEESVDPEVRDVARLERLGSWLAGAIELPFANAAVDDPSELLQLSSLYRLLDRAIASGSETAVVRIFVEALAVWGDIECRAYVRDLAGQFFLAVALPGSDPAQAPASLVLDPVPATSAISRLSPGERRRLGFDEAVDIAVAAVRGRETAQWLMAVSAPTDARWAARLAIYLDVLAQGLTSTTAIGLSRLTWAMTQHLLLRDSPQLAMQAAIGELSAVIDGSACFSLFRSDGLDVLTVGEPTKILVAPAPAKTPHLLILPIVVPEPYAAIIGVLKAGPGAFNRRDEMLLQTTASMLSAWLTPLVQRLSELGDRRVAQRTFDQFVGQYENDPAMLDDLSMVVISVGDALVSPRLARDWISAIRGQLRPTDLVGRLLSGDVGILLLRTANHGAEIVAQRLHRLLIDQSRQDLPSNASVGFATRPRGAVHQESLVEQARARAVTAVRAGTV